MALEKKSSLWSCTISILNSLMGPCCTHQAQVLTYAAIFLCINDSHHSKQHRDANGLWRNPASHLTPMRASEDGRSRDGSAFQFPVVIATYRGPTIDIFFFNQRTDWRSELDSSSHVGFTQIWAVGCLGPAHLHKIDSNLHGKSKNRG